MKVVRIFLEILGWLQITLGVTFVAGIIAFFIYSIWTNHTGTIISLIVLIAGFTLGCIWATKIWIKYGTLEWLSRLRRIS